MAKDRFGDIGVIEEPAVAVGRFDNIAVEQPQPADKFGGIGLPQTVINGSQDLTSVLPDEGRLLADEIFALTDDPNAVKNDLINTSYWSEKLEMRFDDAFDLKAVIGTQLFGTEDISRDQILQGIRQMEIERFRQPAFIATEEPGLFSRVWHSIRDRIVTPRDIEGQIARGPFMALLLGREEFPDLEQLHRKTFKQAIIDAYVQAGNRMVKSLAGRAQQIGDIGTKLGNLLRSNTPEAQQLKNDLTEWGEYMAMAADQWYADNPESQLQIEPGTGFLGTTAQYILHPENVLQGSLETVPMLLTAILGHITGSAIAEKIGFGAKFLPWAGRVAGIAEPEIGEEYTNARAQGLDVENALAQSYTKAYSRAVIEEWVLGEKVKIFKGQFGKAASTGFAKKTTDLLLGGKRAYIRGALEEGTQSVTDRFWEMVWGDSEKWFEGGITGLLGRLTEGASEAAAVGGLLEMGMAGVFSVSGQVVAQAGRVDVREQVRRINQIRRDIQRNETLDDQSKEEIDVVLDEKIIEAEASAREGAVRPTPEAAVGREAAKVEPEGEIVPPEPTAAKPEAKEAAPEAEKPTLPIEAKRTQELLAERREIKQIPPNKRKPQQIQRLNEIENELVKTFADEFPEIDITPKARTVEVKKVRNEIISHGVYQAALEGIEDVPDLSGTFQVDSREISDVRGRFEGRPAILNKFKVSKTGGTRWDQAAQEIGIDSLDEFMDMVELFVEVGEQVKGGINEVALAKALNSGDPSIELFALKHDMLKNGFTVAEINKEIAEFAKREGIDLDDVKSELISLEEITDVRKKQEILRELDKTVKAAAKKKVVQPEQDAIQKAKVRAFKTKQPIFVFERQGQFKVSSKQPRTGEFVKVTPPAAGELAGKTERLEAGPTPAEIKEANLLKQRINIAQKKKGLTKKEFSDLKLKHGGSRRLTGARPRNVEQLKAILKAVERVRPRIVGRKKIVSRKTEKQIAELRTNLTNLGFMNDAEFQKILDIEAGGKEAKFVDAKNFITQRQGRDILNRMHDTAQRLRVTEPVRRAIEKDPDIKAEIIKVEKLPTKAKDPSRLKSMRFFFQRLGEQASQPIYDIFLDLTLEEQLRSRERHLATKTAEKLPDFAKIANDPKALQRVEDWIVSQSVLKGKPKSPKNITENEIRLAKLIQASFKSYETLARAGKFFEFFDNRTEIPQYLQFKRGIDRAFDIYNSKGYDALIKYLDTQDWGIVSAGYSPMESVVKKVSTNRMPPIAVGKGNIRQRGIDYRKQDRDILQRWYSYMRQMDQLVHIQPRIKSLVRLVNDNQASFENPQRINSVVSTYLDNLKHTNYEDGLVEEWSRRLYSQAITVRVLADPLKPIRNSLQNTALAEDRRDFLRLLAKLAKGEKLLSKEETKYLETYVQQDAVMMSDWAFVGEDPILFKNLTKWIQRKTLYPASDRLNRLMSFAAKTDRVRRAFAKEQSLANKMKDARFSDMQKTEQRTALGILAKDGVEAMARYVAKVYTDNTHFLYGREQRSPAEQTKFGKIALNLALFRRAALEKALFQLGKTFEKGTSFDAKLRAANVLVTLLGMSALVGVLWKRTTGQKYSPYSYFSFLELNFGGLEVATIEKAEDAYNSMLGIITFDPEKRGKAIDQFGRDLTKVADYMIPFYDIGLRAIEAIIGSENIDQVPFKKMRELIDGEFESRGLVQINRSLIEKIQFTFAKGGVGEED